MRDNCSTCKNKLKGPRFSCYICKKDLHLTPDCTMFTKEEINVLIKINDSLLHICNECIPKKKDLNTQPEPTSSKLDDQLNTLQEQIKALTEKMEISK